MRGRSANSWAAAASREGSVHTPVAVAERLELQVADGERDQVGGIGCFISNAVLAARIVRTRDARAHS